MTGDPCPDDAKKPKKPLRAGRGAIEGIDGGRRTSTGTVANMGRFVGMLVLDRHGRILLQERDERAVIDPERWGLPGGHVDHDEAFTTAAHRELAEETGIDLGPDGLAFWREFEVFHEAYDSWDRMQVFAAVVDLTDADIVVGEGRQILFVTPERALELPLTASSTTIVPAWAAAADRPF